MKKFSEFFSDGQMLSMSRLMLFIWSMGVLIAWIKTSYVNKTLTPIPDSVLTIIGIFVSGKVVQSFAENKN